MPSSVFLSHQSPSAFTFSERLVSSTWYSVAMKRSETVAKRAHKDDEGKIW